MCMSIVQQILKITNNNLVNGIVISENQIEDDLSEYKLDSISFIKIIVEIEDAFEIEIPDEYLLFHEMNTIAKMADVVTKILDK